jgi:flavin-dependent dehydrogenase
VERVVVVGGGPAGAVAALVLARRGVPVTVLEAHPGPALKVGETLPSNLAPILRHLGLEGLKGQLRSQGNRSLWGSPVPVESPFLANPYGEGWHVDRRSFEASLAGAAVAAGADWRWGARVDRNTNLDAFVADATGRPARLARRFGARFGARRLRYDRLVGVSALLASPTPAQDTYTLVEATPDGWWYSALLADGRLAVAFLGDGDLLDRPLLASDPDAWWNRLRQTEATRERVEVHGYEGGSGIRVLPAETSRLDRIEGDRWLAVGDAAVAYDPLSSYGVGSAMGSGFYAGHAIADLLAGRTDRTDRDTARLAYLDVMQRACDACFELQREAYSRERRWPEAPFWRRRQEAGYLVEAL